MFKTLKDIMKPRNTDIPTDGHLSRRTFKDVPAKSR